MKGLRKILRVSCTAKKTNEWVLNKAGVKRELLDTVKARKLAYCGHTMREQNCLEKEIQGTMPGVRRRGRSRTALIDNIKSWTGLSVEESIRMTEDINKWRKYVHSVAYHNPNSISVGSAVFAQLTTKCPYSLQWAAPSPFKIAHSHGGI